MQDLEIKLTETPAGVICNRALHIPNSYRDRALKARRIKRRYEIQDMVIGVWGLISISIMTALLIWLTIYDAHNVVSKPQLVPQTVVCE